MNPEKTNTESTHGEFSELTDFDVSLSDDKSVQQPRQDVAYDTTVVIGDVNNPRYGRNERTQ